MKMSLIKFHSSRPFRLIASVVLFNFLISQTLYAQEEFQVQEGTHLYTPVKEINAEQLDEKGTGSEGLPVSFFEDALPNPTDFWNDNPLSAPTVEIHVDETWVEVTSAHSVIPAEAGIHGSLPESSNRGSRPPIKAFGGDKGSTFGDDTVDEIASGTSYPRNDEEGKLLRNDVETLDYEYETYSFEDALELIRPEFAAAESVMKKWSPWSYGF